tara:strand:+ start:1335 stop:1862 length:528 start_codon:yes stop_codon:yes gene_type:complete
MKIIGRPGFLGEKKEEKHREYDETYGADNWEMGWWWNERLINFETACQIYEGGYYHDSFNREELWEKLISKARDVYDHKESNIQSGLDYSIQEGTSTHIQDISIRNVVLKRGWEFEGKELIQIRGHSTYWGNNLSPGKVPFHLPDKIYKPNIEGWWKVDSVEDFYQSNRVLIIKS